MPCFSFCARFVAQISSNLQNVRKVNCTLFYPEYNEQVTIAISDSFYTAGSRWHRRWSRPKACTCPVNLFASTAVGYHSVVEN